MTTRNYIDGFKEKTGRMPSHVELSRNLKLSTQAAIQAIIAYSKEEHIKEEKVQHEAEVKNWTVTILRIALVALAAMAFTLSVYFTGLWFYGKFSYFISGLISLSMVLFMVISPQTLRFVKNPFVKAIIAGSFVIALAFSMGSTVAGQYNAITVRIESEPDRSYIFEQLTTSEEEIKQLIEEAQRDKEIHQVSLSLLSATAEERIQNWQSIATERKYIDQFDARIDSLREELKNVRNSTLENGIIEEKRDFYLFISELTGVEKSLIEFIISAMPAVFIDVISALCLNLALFIKEKR